MNFILKIILSAGVVFILAMFLPGISVEDSYSNALIVSLLIGFLNALVRPILIFLTLPATIVTLGAFIWVINAFVILIADRMLVGFNVANFWWALLFSIMLSAINTHISRLLKDRKQRRNVLSQKDTKESRQTIIIED